MFNICFIHNLAEVDHSKFVSSWCYAPRAMFSCWLVNKRIPPREDSQSYLPFSFFFYFPFFLFPHMGSQVFFLAIAMGGGLRLGPS